MNNATINQLHELRLSAMAAALREQQEQPDMASLSFEERLALLVEAEWLSRRSKRNARLVAHADFRFSARLEDIDYTNKRGITRPDVMRLATGAYLKKNLNILISGPTGVGKTYLVCALGRAACVQGVPTLYLRVPDLFRRIADARSVGKYSSLKDKLAKINLLILDDWGLKRFTLEEAQEIMELAERRYRRGATVISGQLQHTLWHDLFPDPTLADAVLDRIVHNAYKYNISGDSMRKVIAEQDLKSNES
jgi:DNA replication protein DnaC